MCSRRRWDGCATVSYTHLDVYKRQQKEYIFPPAPSMRLVIDTIEFGSLFTPRFNPISILSLIHI